MSKKKVHELAEEFKMSSTAMVQMLKEMDIPVKSHMSTVDEELRVQIKKEYERKKEKLAVGSENVVLPPPQVCKTGSVEERIGEVTLHTINSQRTRITHIGILWDIENVTPSKKKNYIQLVLNAVSKGGQISYAMAFGDWSKTSIKDVACELYINNFELIHIPKYKKNSADMSLVAHGVELIFQYPHIDRYVLISGDADFRPLLLSMKKHGKETCVICDVKNNASEDLLRMADDYLGYREIIQPDENINIMPEVVTKLMEVISTEWTLFSKISPKIDFRKYGYKRFIKLALDAEKMGYVETRNHKLVWEIKKAAAY